MRAERAISTKNFDEVIRLTKDMPKTNPSLRIEGAWATLLLGNAYSGKAEYSEGIASFDRVIKEYTDKDNFAGNNVRAAASYFKIRCLERLGRLDEAEETKAFLKRTWPDSSQAKELQ